MPEAPRAVAGRLIGRRFEEADPATAADWRRGAAEGLYAPWEWVAQTVQDVLGPKLKASNVVYYGDDGYYLPTPKELDHILHSSRLDRRRYLEQRFDCDDFAYCLKAEMAIHACKTDQAIHGLCVGIVWGDFAWVEGYHAVNWFIDSTCVLQFIEPQSDVIYSAQECTGEIGLLVV